MNVVRPTSAGHRLAQGWMLTSTTKVAGSSECFAGCCERSTENNDTRSEAANLNTVGKFNSTDYVTSITRRTCLSNLQVTTVSLLAGPLQRCYLVVPTIATECRPIILRLRDTHSVNP